MARKVHERKVQYLVRWKLRSGWWITRRDGPTSSLRKAFWWYRKAKACSYISTVQILPVGEPLSLSWVKDPRTGKKDIVVLDHRIKQSELHKAAR